MAFPALGWGYVVRHSLAATLLVKSATFPKCKKCDRVLYNVKYRMVMLCEHGREFMRTDLSVLLDLRKLP